MPLYAANIQLVGFAHIQQQMIVTVLPHFIQLLNIDLHASAISQFLRQLLYFLCADEDRALYEENCLNYDKVRFIFRA